jgi:pimeloyl-ACP methyl ester carboxylesterase
MPNILANGINVYYEEQGDPKNPVLILIGGLARDHTIWSEVLKQEEMQHFRVIVYDNRGCGQTGPSEGPYSCELFAKDLNALMGKLQVTSAIIVGHSMGGFIAQSFAALYPKRVTKLVLCSTCMLPSKKCIEYLKDRLDLCQRNTPMEYIIQTALPWLCSPRFLTEERVRQMTESMLSNPFPQTLLALEAQIKVCLQQDSRSLVPLIQVPTLVITGTDDLVMAPAEGRALADGLPHGAFVEVAEAAHMIQVEQPKKLSQLIRDFVK